MNYFSFFRKATVLKKTFSVLTLLALLAGGLTGLVYTSTAYANNGVNTYAVPNTGTLVPGQTMDVHMTVTLDPNDTNPVTSPSCLVNGVQVASTFTNLSSGTDGHFRFTYTVGESDTSRAAGQVPISCTLSQTGSVTVTAFDDSNTVAIDTGEETGGGTGTTTPGEGLSAGADGVITYFDPTTGTLTNGQELDLHLKVTLDPNDTNPVTSPVCYVNGINVASTFQNQSSGTDGHFMFTYTVGASHDDRAAGQIPIECTLSQTGSVTVTALDDSNTVAIDATPSGGGGNAPQISSVSINPSSGTLEAGDTVTVTYQATDTATTDLSVSGLCHVNAQDVSSTFTHVGNGAYQFSYTVGSDDGERPAGHIPVSCTFSNANGSVTATGWTDGNTVAIDTNGDGSIDNGTNNLGFTVVADPSAGTLEVGESMTVSMQDPLPSADVVIGSAGCRVNDVDVSGSYIYQGNGLYRVTYTVEENDADRAAGQIPFDCTLENHTGSVHLVAFTDSNTLAVDTTEETGGGTGTTTPGEGLSAGADGVITYFDPTSGTLNIGESADLHLKVGLDPNDTNPVTSPSCLVNGVQVASTFQNLTSGSNGHFKFTYTAASGHTDRAAGQIPISCTLQQTGSVTVTALDDSNTLAIDVSTGTTTATTTGSFSSVAASPNSGTLTVGQNLQILLTVSDAHTGYTTATFCTVNGVDVSGSFQNFNDGTYGLTYTVGANDTDRAAGTVPFMCTINKPNGITASATGFTDSNTVAIDAANDGTIGTSTIAFTSVTADPASGTLGASSTLQVNFQATSTATSLTLGGACTVNSRDVASTFQNLSGGLYRITYTVGSTDTERAAGTIPFSCIFQNNGTATTTVSAFTTANTVAIDLDGNGTTTDTGGNNNGTTTATTTDAALGPTPGAEPVSMVESTATAGGGYTDGWVWIFRVTVPNDETSLQMKFSNWSAVSGTSTIATANNMRISSLQASSTSPVTITAADSYSSPALVLTGDLDPSMAGRQIEIKVEMQVPAGTPNGSYTTNYAIKSF